MSGIAIRAEGLGKKYLIGHNRRDLNPTFRDSIIRGFTSLRRGAHDILRGRPLIEGDEIEEFWALQDLDFEIRQGEVVGIIGRNGAGKSTLLKILSRITEPSEGRVTINGRIASLLEVGTGFHPELTGRENINLNGAILGMSRAEIRRRFDEIVDFSGVESFLDTPVKRYSSGMYVRLAFSVAAHLDPEILIVDEVLAVGDADFQRKCLGKMRSVASSGRTVLLVSHNMASLANLTTTSLYLRNGKLVMSGPTHEVIGEYLKEGRATSAEYLNPVPHQTKPSVAFIRVLTASGEGVHRYGDSLTFEFGLHFPETCPNPCLSFQLKNWQQTPVLHEFIYSPELGPAPAGLTVLTCKMEKPRLNVGDYRLTAYLSAPPGGEVWEVLEEALQFEVVRTDSSPYWGWRNDACTYFEESNWTVNAGPSLQIGRGDDRA